MEFFSSTFEAEMCCLVTTSGEERVSLRGVVTTTTVLTHSRKWAGVIEYSRELMFNTLGFQDVKF